MTVADSGRIGSKSDYCQTVQGGASKEIVVHSFKKPLYYRVIKRLFDVVFSLCVVVIGFIPGLILCLFVMLDTKGSPIYSSTRIGRNGPFKMYKFRSMVADSDDLEKYFDEEQMQDWLTEHKVENDPRVTKIGSFLRKTSIDEIPNFLNVLKSDISIVGPRAITQEELLWFGEDAAKLLSVKPGVTGWWQVKSRNNATYKSGERQRMELFYVDNCSVLLDVKILFGTIGAVVKKTGI